MHKHDAENERTESLGQDPATTEGAGTQTECEEQSAAEYVPTERVDLAAIARRVRLLCGFRLSAHAWMQMTSRAISAEAVDVALAYGRKVHARGARHYVMGRREIERARRNGLDLRRYEGIHVVAVADEPVVCTVYRNRDFKRTLRAAGRPRQKYH